LDALTRYSCAGGEEMKSNIDCVSSIGAEPKPPKKDGNKNLGIGIVLRELRKRKRKTQAEVAYLIGLERTSVVNIESGNQSISILHLNAYAEALGLDVEIVFTDK
jgi:DNA-binding XRE family transcriptional regulator